MGWHLRKAAGPLGRAAQDMRLFLERGYGRDRVITLVGDRWELSADDRHILRRAVFSPDTAATRRAKLLAAGDLAGRVVAVDGHNVIITLETALAGGRLVLADDRLVRDISGVGRHHRPGENTRRAARLMLEFLSHLGVKEVRVYLDQPLPQSGELAAELRGMISDLALAGTAATAPVPEDFLLAHAGPVASADSAVVDAVDMPVDLAGLVLAILDPPPTLESLP